MSNKYELTYCIKCREKTAWISPNNPQLKMTRNHRFGLLGNCCKCLKMKFTLITKVYGQQLRRDGFIHDEPLKLECKGT